MAQSGVGLPDGGTTGGISLYADVESNQGQISFTASFKMPSPATSITYTSSNSDYTGLVEEGTTTWSANYDGTPADTLGSLSVNLSSLGASMQVGSGTVYPTVHGSVQGTLVQQADGGTVSVTGSF
jgi:hypothetical protein